MKITLEKGNYHISRLENHDLVHEVSIQKPEENAMLLEKIAAYYLAAAGGTWTKLSDLVSRFFILSSIMLITVPGIPDRMVVTIKRSQQNQ